MRRLLLIFTLLSGVLGAQEIEVTIFEGGEGLGFYRSVARIVESRNPGVGVLLQGDPAMADRMRMRVLDRSFPEVTNAGVDVWNLVTHKQIARLDAYLDHIQPDGQSWRERFLPGSLTQYQTREGTFGIPLVYVVWSVYYNKELFRRHGFKPPSTWPEFHQLCQRMKKAGLAPVAFQGRYSFYARPLVEHTYFHAAGRQAYRRQQQAQAGSFDNPEMVESLTTLSRLARDDFQKGFLGMSHTEAQLEFFQGRAAMLFCGSWLYSEMQDNIPEDFELGAFSLPLPVPSVEPASAQYTSSGFFFVFSNSAHPELGVEFLKTLTSVEVASRFAAERGIPVAVRSANEALHPAMKDVAEQLLSIKEAFGPQPGPTLKGLDQVWTDNLDRLLSGQVDPSEVARIMEKEAGALRMQAAHPDRVEVRHAGKALAFLGFLILGGVLGLSSRSGGVKGGRFPVSWLEAFRFLGPSLFFFALFFAIPSFIALAAALLRWDGLGAPEYVGGLHLRRLLLESDLFWLALGHNLFLMVVPALFILPLALFLATLLHQGVRGSRLFRVAFFFPNLIGVAGILLWQQLYNPTIGPINRMLAPLGFDSTFEWLSNQNLYYALIPMSVWTLTGFNMVLLLAAMQAVPTHLYEAADVHGASEWHKFRYITLPLIKDTVAVAAVLLVIGGMKAFEAIWLFTNQAPTSETHVVGTLMIRSLFVEQRIGQAAALAVLLFLVVLVGSLLTRKLTEEDS